MSQPAACAIVVTYHTGVRLKECLYALAADLQVSGIVIVDNGNPEAMRSWLDRFAGERAEVRLIRPDRNLGFASAANLGAREAAEPLLLFINPDAVIRRRSVEAMIRAAQGHPSPCLVGGRIFGIDGREQRGARRRELTRLRAMGLGRWTLETAPAPDGPVAMPVISGAFFLMSKQAFLALDGGFDPEYFLHVEDVDLCRRVRAAGGTVIYQPEAGALHYRSTSDVPSQTIARHKADSLTRYFHKFAGGPVGRAANAVFLPLLRWAVLRRGR